MLSVHDVVKTQSRRLVLFNGLRPETSVELYADIAARLREHGIDVLLINGHGCSIPVLRDTDLLVSNTDVPAPLSRHRHAVIGRAVSRPQSMGWLASAGIPVMDWKLARTRFEVFRLFGHWGVDKLLLKPSFTGGGRGVRVFTRRAVWRLKWKIDRDVFCKEVNPDDGTVYKAELFNGHMIISWMSHAPPIQELFSKGIYGGLKGSYGDRELTEFPAPLRESLCLLSRQLTGHGIGYVSVDLMRRPDGQLVAIEMNTRDVACWWTSRFPDMRERYTAALEALTREIP